MTVAALDIEELIARASTLYSLPSVAAQVLELTSSPSVDARRLKECIECDPALTGKILRVVNSSLFGLSREVADLNQALALLGSKPLKLLVLGFSLPDALFAGLAGESLDRFWQRTLLRAVAAREICQALWQTAGEEAFLAGLLRDLGMLVMIQELGGSYVQFLQKTQGHTNDLLALERQALGIDRTQVTAGLLASWKLPGFLIDAASSTRIADGVSADSGGLAECVQLGDLIAGLLIDAPLRQSQEVALAARRLGLELPRLATMLEVLHTKAGELSQLLSLGESTRGDYGPVIVEAQRRLALAASEAAGELAAFGANTAPHTTAELTNAAESRLLAAAVQRSTRRKSAESSTRIITGKSNSPEAKLWTGSHTEHLRPAQRKPVSCPMPSGLSPIVWAIDYSRQLRQGLALLQVELDHYPELIFLLGVQRARQFMNRLQQLGEELDHDPRRCLSDADARVTVVLPCCERRLAVELSQQLLGRVRGWSAEFPQAPRKVTASIGIAAVAMPSRNFAAENLLQASQRALFGAQSSGGDCLKSIEVS